MWRKIFDFNLNFQLYIMPLTFVYITKVWLLKFYANNTKSNSKLITVAILQLLKKKKTVVQSIWCKGLRWCSCQAFQTEVKFQTFLWLLLIFFLSSVFLIQGSNPVLLAHRQTLSHWAIVIIQAVSNPSG